MREGEPFDSLRSLMAGSPGEPFGSLRSLMASRLAGAARVEPQEESALRSLQGHEPCAFIAHWFKARPPEHGL